MPAAACASGESAVEPTVAGASGESGVEPTAGAGEAALPLGLFGLFGLLVPEAMVATGKDSWVGLVTGGREGRSHKNRGRLCGVVGRGLGRHFKLI